MATRCDSEFVSSLSGEVLEKAKRELNEVPEERSGALEGLRRKIVEREIENDPDLEGVTFERKDDAFLIRFLRARKFDQDRALELYTHYYKSRAEHAAIFEDFTPKSVEGLLRAGIFEVLDGRLREGPKAVCCFPDRWDMDEYPPHLMLRAGMLVLEKLLEDEETQVHGVCVFQCLGNASIVRFWQVAQLDYVRQGVMPKLIQNCFPARLKGVHLIEQPWYVGILLGIMKSFMKEKLRNRIFIHGSDWESLHQHMAPENLPQDFGGHLPPLDGRSALRLFSKELDS